MNQKSKYRRSCIPRMQDTRKPIVQKAIIGMVVRVKLQTETARKIGSARRVAPRGKLSTGTALDAPLKAMKGVSIRPVFPPNEKFAAQRAEFGLDQWFEIEFDSDMSSREAAGLLKTTAGVSNASVRYPVVLFDGNAQIGRAHV